MAVILSKGTFAVQAAHSLLHVVDPTKPAATKKRRRFVKPFAKN
jgi:hypothetical protein